MNRTCENCTFFENLYAIGPGGPCYTCECNSNFVLKEEEKETYIPDPKKWKTDPVSHPNHYQSKSGLEVIDVINAFTEDLTGVESYYTGNILKYICRWKKKNGLEDLRKARQYLDWLIKMKTYDEMEVHPHHSGPKPFSEMTKEDVKRELNRIYGTKYQSEKNDCCSCGGNCKSEEKKEDNTPSDIISIIWNGLCDVMLKEINEEETKKALEAMNASQMIQTNYLIQETILNKKEKNEDEK